MPCGHGFENRASTGLLNGSCPSCRQDITLVGVALDKRRALDKLLTLHPEFYSEVYFNLDHFAEIVSNNQLNTTMGEHFIKLLQHAANHLNDHAIDGLQKNKTAIEILASNYQGRELLRKNEKLRALLLPESLRLQVNGKTIDEWIKIKKEEFKAIPVPSAPPLEEDPRQAFGLFANRNAPSSNSAVRAMQPQHADNIWQRVVYGNEDGALEMLRAEPWLIERKATVVDYSGRVVDDATPFQAALRAGDEIMAEKMKAIYLEANPDKGQAVLDEQYHEVFPKGYAVHLREQQENATEFLRDILNPLLWTMQRASEHDLIEVCEKRDNHSELLGALNKFRAVFTTVSCSEKVFNPYHLLKAFEKHNEKEFEIDSYYVARHLFLRDLFWRMVIGWQERFLPANYAQSFCTGLDDMVDHHQPLQRIFNLRNRDTYRDIHFFPLDTDPDSRIGVDIAVYNYRGRGTSVTERDMKGEIVGQHYSKLISSKNRKLEKLMQPELLRRRVHGCQVQ